MLDDVPTTGHHGLCMLPGGVLAVARGEEKGQAAVSFVAARHDYDPQALAAYRASSLAARRFEWLTGLTLTNDGLLACSMEDPSAALYKFALDGSMDELATVPALDDYSDGIVRCAVHQQTQRTFALGIGEQGTSTVVILDADLQVIATVEATDAPPEDTDEEYEPICDLTVHGDQVIVLTSDVHPEGSGLRLLDLDGRYQRTIAAGKFGNPHAVTAYHGRAFVVEDDEDDEDDDEDEEEEEEDDDDLNVLHVIDIQSGEILQSVHFELQGMVSTILVDHDEIYIASHETDPMITVLRFAGSEA